MLYSLCLIHQSSKGVTLRIRVRVKNKCTFFSSTIGGEIETLLKDCDSSRFAVILRLFLFQNCVIHFITKRQGACFDSLQGMYFVLNTHKKVISAVSSRSLKVFTTTNIKTFCMKCRQYPKENTIIKRTEIGLKSGRTNCEIRENKIQYKRQPINSTRKVSLASFIP